MILTLPHILDFIALIPVFVFMYHYERNGNPWNFGDFMSRVLWGLTVAFGYVFLSQDNFNLWVVPYFAVAGFVSLLIPHAFAQNMGHYPIPWSLQTGGVKKYWPGGWLPQYNQVEWTALPQWKKIMLDFLGMMSEGLVVGALLFLPTLFFGFHLVGVLSAMAVTMMWDPLAYLLGRLIPFQAWDNAPHSAEWGEFLVPIGRVIAFAALIWAALSWL